MATALTKRVVRRCERVGNQGRRLVVILYPGDMIGIREERRRTTYTAPLDKVYWMLAKWTVQEQQRVKASERKARRG